LHCSACTATRHFTRRRAYELIQSTARRSAANTVSDVAVAETFSWRGRRWPFILISQESTDALQPALHQSFSPRILVPRQQPPPIWQSPPPPLPLRYLRPLSLRSADASDRRCAILVRHRRSFRPCQCSLELALTWQTGKAGTLRSGSLRTHPTCP